MSLHRVGCLRRGRRQKVLHGQPRCFHFRRLCSQHTPNSQMTEAPSRQWNDGLGVSRLLLPVDLPRSSRATYYRRSLSHR
jgi:hypothetical protein